MNKSLWEKYTQTVKPLDKNASQDKLPTLSCVMLSGIMNDVMQDNVNIISPSILKNASDLKPNFVKNPPIKTETIPKNQIYKQAEKNQKRLMRSGHFAYDAKIDLHGYTQITAYDALYSFITHHYNVEKRHILIVVGKGKYCPQNRTYTGILNPLVTQWFHDSAFAPYISVYETAASCDGGAGAYYVILNKKIY
jgi:DNA-nicking Smr family endonuclease